MTRPTETARVEAMLRFVTGGIAAGLTTAEIKIGLEARWPDYSERDEIDELHAAFSRRLNLVQSELSEATR